MNAELLLIPSAGTAAESDAALTEALAFCGAEVTDRVTLTADPRDLKRALRTAVERSDLIVVCGGIGFEPTDTAVATVCAAVGGATRQDAGVLARLKAAYPEREEFGAAALVPEEGTLLTAEGTPFAGAALTAGGQTLLLLPDEPAALAALLKSAVPAALNAGRGFSVAEEESEPIAAPVAAAAPAVIRPREAVFLDEEEDEPAAPVEDADALFAPVEPQKEEPVAPPPVADPATEWDADLLAARAGAETAGDLTPAAPAEKQGFLKTTLRFFLPWKGDGLPDIVRKVVFVLAIVGIVVSGAYIYDYFAAKLHNDAVLNEARELYDPTDTTVGESGSLNRFNGLLAQNKDCRGWITITNTDINNPVYQTKDNDFYLHHDATGKENVYGAVFADYRDTISASGNSQNVTLYGHHMKDGSMFADLHKYKSMDFYKQNPIVTFDTIYGKGGEYKIFACMLTNAEAKDDNGYFFDFTVPSFENEDAFSSWIEQIRRRSLYITPVDVQPGDEILTLSTCSYELKDVELRCVVVARKVRANEAARVNVTEVSYNSKILYPAAWYAQKGGAKPVYEDGLTTWLAQPDYEKYLQQQNENPVSSEEEAASGEDGSGETASETASEAASEGSAEGGSSEGASSEATTSESSSEATSSEGTATSEETSSEAAVSSEESVSSEGSVSSSEEEESSAASGND